MIPSATVLLVEDDESLLQGIADLLELADTGYQIRILQAVNGQQGLDLIRQIAPDLIISDIMMPKMDGLEFLTNVRQNGRWVHIPFIFLTAMGDKKDVYAGQLTGAELYITKPFNNQELLELVKTQLDRTFQLQTLHREKLDKLKRDVLQLLNHEFRTPLTYVTAYYEMLADSLLLEDGSNLQDYLRGIQVGCVRLTRLVEDLIRLVDLRTGQARALYEQRARPLSNVGEMLADAGVLRRDEAAEKGIELAFEIAPELPAVYGSSDFLLEIFDRLIDNAIKFTYNRKRQDGRIILRAWARNGELCLTVADNGVGFPAHARHQIFDLFSQYNREQMEQQGSGSGLAIAQGLAELHNGQIEATSQEGVGSEFTVVLPVYQDRRDPGQSEPPPRRATVLVVEDDYFLLEGLRELLELDGGRYKFHVLAAGNGQEALEILKQHQPDLILSDIMMPVMDGYDLLAQLRQNPVWLQIPFIFLSAKGERRDIHHGRRQGAEQYITKPYDSDELLNLVSTQLDRHFQVQGVINQSFEELKRGILGLLQPDFKMPLDSVTDLSQQLAVRLVKAKTDADLRDSLTGLQTASGLLTRLVEDFITLAELRTGETEASYQKRAAPVHAEVLLYDVSIADWPHWVELPVQLPTEGKLPLIYGDEQALIQLLQRLVETAGYLWSRSEDGQMAALTAATDGQELFLSVCLEGVGFTAAEAEEVRGLFVDNDQATLQVVGYGPNLTIAKGIAELHNGRLQLENEPDQRCTLTLCLPVYTPQDK